MIAGVNLGIDDVYVAVLGEGLETRTVETDEEIIELIKECGVVAVNAPLSSGKELEDIEEEVIEEGYIFTPGENMEKLGKRARFLERMAQRKGLDTEFIRFEPMITSQNLALDGDKSLEGLGIDPSCIGSSEEFDAVLGAVTARFYEEGQYEDLGIVVPEPLHNT